MFSIFFVFSYPEGTTFKEIIKTTDKIAVAFLAFLIMGLSVIDDNLFSFSNIHIFSSNDVTYSFFFLRDKLAASRFRIILVVEFLDFAKSISTGNYNLQLLLVLEIVLKFGLIGVGDISSFGNVLLPFIDFTANTANTWFESNEDCESPLGIDPLEEGDDGVSRSLSPVLNFISSPKQGDNDKLLIIFRIQKHNLFIVHKLKIKNRLIYSI
ncbi:hypothetical protein AGLY_017736 [Aphis glycines]|uniref:Uncharacterized protein n=1 Tax=Aphis glycines TaxID=307491 RepID=A0A6G0SV64_APHGL|nr:hypothetical protein AGLY_017736 [Aphis glycines]